MFRWVVSLLFVSSCLMAGERFDEKRIKQISQCFERYGIDLYNPTSYEEVPLAHWHLVAEELAPSCRTYLSVLQLPILATPEEWVWGITLITTGIALYPHPFTRPAGIFCIRTGLTVIGVTSINDFRSYAREKGWLSKEDWNVFNKILDDDVSTNKEGANG